MKEFIVPITDESNMKFIIKELHLQELVRCGECSYSDSHLCAENYCLCRKSSDAWIIRKVDWFCADGVKEV